ncbi:MAG: pro-sigmaK processing inhibitor BofA family protein [Halanaerobiales bacterium]|nr:pro-sigmaK processing inhibitor BofA family protein [Halanaerobiales bacterium]
MNWQTVIAYLFGLGLIYLFIRILYYPIKVTTKILLNAVVGILVLLLINLVGKFFTYSLSINPVTALVVGFLGIPGVVLLMLLKFFIS